ncbi:hypothetical protein M0804_003939 [Polistes exclamans]|nr:hypothetical protein M0804_003939 [Polistes exclamans]
MVRRHAARRRKTKQESEKEIGKENDKIVMLANSFETPKGTNVAKQGGQIRPLLYFSPVLIQFYGNRSSTMQMQKLDELPSGVRGHNRCCGRWLNDFKNSFHKDHVQLRTDAVVRLLGINVNRYLGISLSSTKCVCVIFAITILVYIAVVFTEPVIEPECPEDDGPNATLIKDPYHCDSYYVCVEGEPILMKCPPGLHFHDKLKTWVYLAPREEPFVADVVAVGTATATAATVTGQFLPLLEYFAAAI